MNFFYLQFNKTGNYKALQNACSKLTGKSLGIYSSTLI